MSANLAIVEDYLKGRGFAAEEISEGRIETNDLMTNPYRDNNYAARFILSQTVTVRSGKVDLIEQALRSSGELVSKGVVFDSQSYGSPVSYIFTRLNDIKPQMLEEATRNCPAGSFGICQEFRQRSRQNPQSFAGRFLHSAAFSRTRRS